MLSMIADVVGIMSFIISVVTLYIASQINRKLLKKEEKRQFSKIVDEIITDFMGFDASLTDDDLFDRKLLTDIAHQSEMLLNEYPQVLGRSKWSLRKLVKHINLLLDQMSIQKTERANESLRSEKKKVLKELRKSIANLRKDKVLI